MNANIVVCSLLLFVATPFSVLAQEFSAPLYYDQSSGNVTIDVTDIPGGQLRMYVIGLGFPGMRHENFAPFIETAFVTSNPYGVGEGTLGDGVAAGVYSLGTVLPSGLSEDELGNYFTRQDSYLRSPGQEFIGELGTGARRGYDFNIIHSPSPHTPVNVNGSNGAPHHDRWADAVQLQYNPGDGSLTLNAGGERGGALAMYLVESPLFDTDAFTGIHPDYSQASNGVISEVSFGGIAEGVYNLGSVLPIGLSNDELDAAITSASFIGLPGHSAGALDINSAGLPMSLAVIPEPSALGSGLMALLGFGAFVRRRRQG